MVAPLAVRRVQPYAQLLVAPRAVLVSIETSATHEQREAAHEMNAPSEEKCPGGAPAGGATGCN